MHIWFLFTTDRITVYVRRLFWCKHFLLQSTNQSKYTHTSNNFERKKTHECGIRQRICVYQWGAAAIHVLPSVSIVVLLWWYYIDFMWSRIKFDCFFSLASSSSSSSPKMFFFSFAVDETPSLRFHCIYVNVFLGNKFDGFYIANMYRSIWFTSESRSKIFFISTRTFPKSKTFLQNAPIFD